MREHGIILLKFAGRLGRDGARMLIDVNAVIDAAGAWFGSSAFQA
ncbi:MAG TPA: hypothetical protein VKY22_31470 [Bradyrhizobium sp.]|nr:hypothetical protein [Bradyrhizobium sp.]